MMEYRDSIFQTLLADYNYDQIEPAMLDFVKHHADLPTPSDIVNRIEAPKPLSGDDRAYSLWIGSLDPDTKAEHFQLRRRVGVDAARTQTRQYWWQLI